MTSLFSDSFLSAIEQGIMGLLLILGIACIGAFAWRWRALGLAVKGTTGWRMALEGNLTGDKVSEPLLPFGSAPESACADRVARLGLRNAGLCPEALEKLLENQEIKEKKILERGARFLGTVGANAPFLGLTGTVLGILAAFRRMAAQGGSGGVEVMSAISGALIATATGLVVAIPAVVLYNVLKARIKDTTDGLAEIRGLLLVRSLQAAAREVI
ncbi:MAG: MotA/TolQ/ExbB proton channel family protein [Fibrobacteria bacterium]